MSETTCECCGAPTKLAKTLDLHGGFVGMMHKEYVPPQTPLQVDALDALVAWREGDKAMMGKSGGVYYRAKVKMPPIEEALRLAADLLITERAKDKPE